MKEQLLCTAAGIIGAGVASWRLYFPWVAYDLPVAKARKATRKEIEAILKNGDYMIDLFEKNVARYPNKVMLIHEDTEYTYGFVNDQANRVANVVKSWDVELGETVAMMIYNEPAFVWTLLGLFKLGIVAALINFNIRKDALTHSVNICGAKYLIVGRGKQLLEAVGDVKSELNIPVYVQDEPENLCEGFLSFNLLMSRSYPAAINKARRENLTPRTHMSYVFTSGTTGLPKAGIFRQGRGITLIGYGIATALTENDVIYNTLPLYHSAGCYVGLFTLFSTGCTMVLRNKFSASQFFSDCRRHDVTAIQYTGELLRYLVAQPESHLDTEHKIRMAIGNGLRKDIWVAFQKRFNIPHIYEFFGATDSSGSFLNMNNKPGAVGRQSPLLRLLGVSALVLVKYNEDTATPIRDKNGRCVHIQPGEQGLVLGPLTSEFSEVKEKFYKGNVEGNEKKLVRNAFLDGDMYFNYGDVMYLDKDYFVYFRDRLGDTFRWKGENVSTTEVANSLTCLDFIEDVSVYGVEVPGAEGKAGMAAIFLNSREEPVTKKMLMDINRTCKEKLPSYARPLFLRFPKEMQMTSTFKHTKVGFRKEAYDLNIVKDPLFFMDKKMDTYVPLTQEINTMLKTKSKL